VKSPSDRNLSDGGGTAEAAAYGTSGGRSVGETEAAVYGTIGSRSMGEPGLLRGELCGEQQATREEREAKRRMPFARRATPEGVGKRPGALRCPSIHSGP